MLFIRGTPIEISFTNTDIWLFTRYISQYQSSNRFTKAQPDSVQNSTLLVSLWGEEGVWGRGVQIKAPIVKEGVGQGKGQGLELGLGVLPGQSSEQDTGAGSRKEGAASSSSRGISIPALKNGSSGA